MALSLDLQQIANNKPVGTYFIERTVGQAVEQPETSGYRLLIGQSKIGLTNKIMRIDNWNQFKSIFGDVDRREERRGNYFHRSAYFMLQQGSIKVLNVRAYDDTLDTLTRVAVNTEADGDGNSDDTVAYTSIIDTRRNWFIEREDIVDTTNTDQLLTMVSINAKPLTVFIRPMRERAFNQTINEYYQDVMDKDVPSYLLVEDLIDDTFIEVYVFQRKFEAPNIQNDPEIGFCFDVNGAVKKNVVLSNGDTVDALDFLSENSASSYLGGYVGSLIPTLTDRGGNSLFVCDLVNADVDATGVVANINIDILDTDSDFEFDYNGKTLNTEFYSNVGKQPLSIDLIGHSMVGWNVSSYDNNYLGSAQEFLSLLYASVGTSFDTNKLWNFTYSEEFLQELTPSVDLKVERPDAAITHYQPFILGQESVTSDIVTTYSYNTGDTYTIKGKDYNSLYSVVMSSVTSPKIGDTFAGKDGNLTRIINLDFIGQKDVIEGLHSRVLPLDTDGTPLGDYDTPNEQWLYPVGHPNAGSPIEYNVSVAPFEQTYGYPLDDIGGSVIAFPDIDETDLDALKTSFPDLVSTVNYFIATFDRLVYFGDDMTSYILGLRDNKSVLTLNDGTEIITFRPSSAQGTKMVKIGRPVEVAQVYKPIVFDAFVARDAQFMNNSRSRLNEILDTTVLGDLRDLLKDKEYEQFNYIVDGFKSFIGTSMKSQLTRIASERQICTALINMPFYRDFKKSTDPYFRATTSSNKFLTEYLRTGGNLDLPYTQRHTFPTKNDGASYGATYFPNFMVDDNGTPIEFPAAPLVSNNFAQKWLTNQGHLPVFGDDEVVSNPAINKAEFELTEEERNDLEKTGINPITQELKVLGNLTLQQDGRATEKLHKRETINVLLEQFRPIAKSFVGKFNNSANRSSAETKLNQVLERYLGNGALEYAKAQVDQFNNPPEVRAEGLFVMDVEVVISDVIEKVVLRLTAYRTLDDIDVAIL